MAIYHLSARPPICRGQGRTATAAAAYRAGANIHDVRTGLIYDYRRKRGVLDARIMLPGGLLVPDRAGFWNSVEQHHRRRDAVVAREVVIALPIEIDAWCRARLATTFAQEIADEFGVAVDCALHEPSRDGDDRNYHAHLLLSACAVAADGVLGTKATRLDPIACKRNGIADSVAWLRPRWESLVNEALARGGSSRRVDHRSYAARGIAQRPTIHVGRKAAAKRIRGTENAKRAAQNTRVMALDDQLRRLARIRARLAARAEAVEVKRIKDDLESKVSTVTSPPLRSLASRIQRAREIAAVQVSPVRRGTNSVRSHDHRPVEIEVPTEGKRGDSEAKANGRDRLTRRR